jgi:hypothetical protein
MEIEIIYNTLWKNNIWKNITLNACMARSLFPMTIEHS